MFTKEQLLQAIPDIPAEFSLAELEAVLSRPRPQPGTTAPPRPANLTPDEAADWDYYTSPEAQALYARFPVSPKVAALRGSLKLASGDEHKSYDELRWEAMREKYLL